MKRIALKTVLALMRRNHALKQPFSLKFIKKNGEIVFAKNVIQTSSFFSGQTRNILFENGQIRKIRNISIIEYNQIEVYV